ncbi:hypothetical protein Hte_000070 [Hypoxylon texense]
MVALFSEWVNIGSIVGSAVTNATKSRLDKASYQIPLGTLFIVPAFLAVGLLFVPESPRYLLYKGKTEAARKSLEKLRGDSLSPEAFELEWVEMVKGIEEEKHTASTIGPLDMFKGTELRRTLLCYGVIATQTGAGSWFIISYSTYFLIVSGLSVDEAFKYSVMNTGAKYAYIWAASNFCCLIFFYLCIPETKGRTLEEIDELFANRVSVRKFKGFETSIAAEALKDVEGRSPGAEKKLTTTEHIDEA